MFAFLIIAVLGSGLAITMFLISHKREENPVFAKPAIIVVVCLLTALIVQMIRSNSAMVTEMLHYQYVSMTYYERWNEYIEKTCTECVARDTTGSCTQTRTYDCSYVEDHPPRWESTLNTGSGKSVSEDFFNQTAALWGNKTFRDLRRKYHTIDGDAYDIYMPMKDNVPTSPKVVGFTTTGKYENRIAFSKSVFNYRTVDSTEIANYGLFTWSESSLMGAGSTTRDRHAKMILDNTNYIWGLSRQLSLRMVIFNGHSVDAGFMQENHWRGGNKNEFNVCVGLDRDSTISWVKIISWTTNEMLKIQVRDSIVSMGKFDSYNVAKFLSDYVPPRFQRREFAEFKYIELPTTASAYVVAIIIPLIAFIILFFVSFDSRTGSLTTNWGMGRTISKRRYY